VILLRQTLKAIAVTASIVVTVTASTSQGISPS